MVVARRAEAELRKGERDPIVYLYTKLAVDHFRELKRDIERSEPKNRELKKFISSVRIDLFLLKSQRFYHLFSYL